MDNKTFAKYLDLPALNGEHFGSASKRAGRLAGKHAGGHTDRLANVAICKRAARQEGRQKECRIET